MRINIDFCTYTLNKSGNKMLETRYSNAYEKDFNTIEDARLFCKGVVAGLYAKFSKPAVRMNVVCGKSEEIFDEDC